MIYDAIVVGAGPAGLSAGIYLARFRRSVLLIDKGHGRSTCYELNENYLGFPSGIHSRTLRKRGEIQAKRFGATFLSAEVTKIEKMQSSFRIHVANAFFQSRTVILATGVRDHFPQFFHYKQCIGRSLFWCITCDGYKTRGKSIILVGNNNEAGVTALQFLNFTRKISLITNQAPHQTALSKKLVNMLMKKNIVLLENRIEKITQQKGMIQTVELENGKTLTIDFLFSMQGASPNNILAQQLGVQSNQAGYILVGEEQRTNIPFVYAAGDITRVFSHQIVTAAHEGSMAAQAANYDLYHPWQKEDFYKKTSLVTSPK